MSNAFTRQQSARTMAAMRALMSSQPTGGLLRQHYVLTRYTPEELRYLLLRGLATHRRGAPRLTAAGLQVLRVMRALSGGQE